MAERSDMGADDVSGADALAERLAHVEAERDALAVALAAARASNEASAGDELLRNAFFAMASHELRTPIQTIALQIEVLLTRVGGTADEVPTEWLADRLVRVRRAVDAMRHLVDGLLNTSEISSGHLELHPSQDDLGELAEGVVANMRDALTWAGCRCDVETSEPALGQWDRLRLEVVLHNLLTNAMKYASGEPIFVRVGRDGDRAALSVSDQGPGIPREDHGRIFDRFERVSATSKVPGFGLGLWIVRLIMLAHGGEVRVQSAPGQGATFTVLLPAVWGSTTRA